MSDFNIEKILELGNEWKGGSHHRVYFNDFSEFGLDVSFYKTGNVSGATWQGESLSNGKATEMLSAKIYYDMNENKFVIQFGGRMAQELLDAVVDFFTKKDEAKQVDKVTSGELMAEIERELEGTQLRVAIKQTNSMKSASKSRVLIYEGQEPQSYRSKSVVRVFEFSGEHGYDFSSRSNCWKCYSECLDWVKRNIKREVA